MDYSSLFPDPHGIQNMLFGLPDSAPLPTGAAPETPIDTWPAIEKWLRQLGGYSEGSSKSGTGSMLDELPGELPGAEWDVFRQQATDVYNRTMNKGEGEGSPSLGELPQDPRVAYTQQEGPNWVVHYKDGTVKSTPYEDSMPGGILGYIGRYGVPLALGAMTAGAGALPGAIGGGILGLGTSGGNFENALLGTALGGVGGYIAGGSGLPTAGADELTGLTAASITGTTPADIAAAGAISPELASELATIAGGVGSIGATAGGGAETLPQGMNPLDSYTFGGAPSQAENIAAAHYGSTLASTIPEAYQNPPAFQLGGPPPYFMDTATPFAVDELLAPSGFNPLDSYIFGGKEPEMPPFGGNEPFISGYPEKGIEGTGLFTPNADLFLPTPTAAEPFFQVNPALNPETWGWNDFGTPTTPFTPGTILTPGTGTPQIEEPIPENPPGIGQPEEPGIPENPPGIGNPELYPTGGGIFDTVGGFLKENIPGLLLAGAIAGGGGETRSTRTDVAGSNLPGGMGAFNPDWNSMWNELATRGMGGGGLPRLLSKNIGGILTMPTELQPGNADALAEMLRKSNL